MSAGEFVKYLQFIVPSSVLFTIVAAFARRANAVFFQSSSPATLSARPKKEETTAAAVGGSGPLLIRDSDLSAEASRILQTRVSRQLAQVLGPGDDVWAEKVLLPYAFSQSSGHSANSVTASSAGHVSVQKKGSGNDAAADLDGLVAVWSVPRHAVVDALEQEQLMMHTLQSRGITVHKDDQTVQILYPTR
eukprot:ANDGO_06548.mRNA.1 hypothetical protein